KNVVGGSPREPAAGSNRAVERGAAAGPGSFAGGSLSVRRRAGARARAPASGDGSRRREPLPRPSVVHASGRALLLRPRTGGGVAPPPVATAAPESRDRAVRCRQELVPEGRPAASPSCWVVGARVHPRRPTLCRVGPGAGAGA